MPRPSSHPHHQTGFSLLEMAVVLTIIAILTAGTLSVGGSVIDSARQAGTNNKLDAIQEALKAFRLANNRLPCPNDPALTESSANYGYETGATGSCTGGSIDSYAVPSPPSSTTIPGGTTVVEGAVPVKALGLPNEFMYDGWGRKFAYAVWTPLTATDAFVSYGAHSSCGAITIKNAGGGNRSADGAYALVSFGPDGNGGYLENGTRVNGGVTNADELTNCHCTSTGADAGNYAATYIQKDINMDVSDATHPFNDIVRFKERWQMQNDYDAYNPNGAPCYSGASITPYLASGQMGQLAVGDVNGDGIPDLIISAPFTNSATGSIFVVFGTKNGFPDPLPLSSCNGTNCAEFDGPEVSQYISSLAVADVNGDGFGDIIAGAFNSNGQGGDPYFGSTFVIFGHAGTWNATPQTLDSTFVNGTNAIQLDGPTYQSRTGWSVAGGDVNGDGIADIVIGVPRAGSEQAYSYIRFNRFSNVSPPANGAYIVLNGVTWTFVTSCTPNCVANNETQIATGQGPDPANLLATISQLATDLTNSTNPSLTVASYTDQPAGGPALYIQYKTPGTVGNSYTLNVDNVCTISPCTSNIYLIAMFSDDTTTNTLIDGADGISDAGSVYVVFGQKCGGSHFPACSTPVQTLNSTLLNGTTGIEYDGTVVKGQIGSSVAVGDVNGDGIGDLLIGSGLTDAYTFTNNQSFVIFGQKCGGVSSGFTACASPDTALTSGTAPLDGTHGAEFDAPTGPPSSSTTVVASGDVNGDGISDLIIGAPANIISSTANGSVYVIYGKKTGWPATAQALNSSFINGINGVEFDGTSFGQWLGTAVASGDVNGDGISDLLFSSGYVSGGSSYVIFGGNPLLPVPSVTTTANSNIASVSSVTGLAVGQTVYASTIPAGDSITAIDPVLKTITLNTGTGVTAGGPIPPVAMYVASEPINGSTLFNGVFGSEFTGSDPEVYADQAITTGDINGDGIADIIFASPAANSYAGQVYFYLGHKNTIADPWPSSPYNLGGM